MAKAERKYYFINGQYWVRWGYGPEPALGPFDSLKEAMQAWTRTRHRQSRAE